MKQILRFGVALFTFCIGVIAALAWLACRLPAHTQPVVDTNVSQSSVERAETKENSEGEDSGCLDPNISKPKTIYFGVLNSKAVDIPKPEYPTEAKAAKISGEVKAEVVVDETGKVIWARVHTGHPLLQAAVNKVVCLARLKPINLSGRPVKVNGIITYKFVLE